MGRGLKSLEHMAVSPEGSMLAFRGASGYVHVCRYALLLRDYLLFGLLTICTVDCARNAVGSMISPALSAQIDKTCIHMVPV